MQYTDTNYMGTKDKRSLDNLFNVDTRKGYSTLTEEQQIAEAASQVIRRNSCISIAIDSATEIINSKLSGVFINFPLTSTIPKKIKEICTVLAFCEAASINPLDASIYNDKQRERAEEQLDKIANGDIYIAGLTRAKKNSYVVRSL